MASEGDPTEPATLDFVEARDNVACQGGHRVAWPSVRWGEVFGDAAVAGAMIDRLAHHATVVNLKGESCQLKDRDLGRVPTDDAA